jgi:hypothetical protein
MNALIRLSETAVEKEILGLPEAIVFGVSAFILFAVLLFAVTRLNPDR